MSETSSRTPPSSGEFQENAAHRRGLAARLRDGLAKTREGGGEKERQRHVSRGKLPVRERIERLLDPDTAFLEVAPLAGHGLYDGAPPGTGLVTGLGKDEGRADMIVANDAPVKGGTYYPVTVKKHLRAQEIAPRIVSRDLPRGLGRCVPAAQAEVFLTATTSGGSSTTRRTARPPADRGRPRPCTAGGAYVPAMSDETVIVKNQGTIFRGRRS